MAPETAIPTINEPKPNNTWTKQRIVNHYLDHNLPPELTGVIKPQLNFDDEAALIGELTQLAVAEVRKILIDTNVSREVKNLVHEYLDYGIETSPEILLHSISVALEMKDFCDQLDTSLGFSSDQAFVAGLFHDYGRYEKRIMAITTENTDNAMFNGTIDKPKLKLSPPEWGEIIKHPAIGYETIKAKAADFINDPAICLILDCVLHHQRWPSPTPDAIENQRSYPTQKDLEKLGEYKEIPIIALLTTLADAYSARQDPFRHFYQKPQTPEQVLPAMREELGTHFDEALGQAFLDWEEKKLKE